MSSKKLSRFYDEIEQKEKLIERLNQKLDSLTTPISSALYRERISQLHKRVDLLSTVLKLHEAYQNNDDNIYQLEQSFTILYNSLYRPLHPELIKGNLNRTKTLSKLKKLKKNHKEFYNSIISRIKPYISTDAIVYPTTTTKDDYSLFWQQIEHSTLPFTKNIDWGQGDLRYKQVETIINQILENIHIHLGIPNKWSTTTQTTKNTFSVHHDSKTIKIPTKPRPAHKLKGLVHHEVFVHILRGLYGEKYNLLNPLPDYRPFEEGLGKTIQQLSEGREEIKIEFYTQPLIITLSNIGLTFEEIEKFLLLTHKDSKKYLKRAQTRTIEHRFLLEQIDFDVLHNKDISYGVGGLLLRTLSQTVQDPHTPKDLKNAIIKIFEIILRGKFDPTNPLHIGYLQENNIITLDKGEYEIYLDFLESPQIRALRDSVPKLL